MYNHRFYRRGKYGLRHHPGRSRRRNPDPQDMVVTDLDAAKTDTLKQMD
jgi:hypothetical protein